MADRTHDDEGLVEAMGRLDGAIRAKREATRVCAIHDEEHGGDVRVVELNTVEVGPLPMNMCAQHRLLLERDVRTAASGR